MACWAAIWGAMTALVLGDRARFDSAVDAAVERAGQFRQPLLTWLVSMVLALRHMLSGRLEDAEALAGETFEVGRAAGIPDARLVVGTQRMWIRYEQGRLDEFVEAFSRAAARPDPDPLTGPILAMVLAELGRVDEARAIFEPLAADGFRGLPDNYSALYSLAIAAAASCWIGHQEGSAVLYERLLPHRGLVAHAGSVGSGCVDHYLGLLATAMGRLDEADRHFREAVAVNQRLEAPVWLARTRLEWGELLRRRGGPGDAEHAAELLGQALTTAVALGLGAVERRARALLETEP
jgi:tetratricopeptide (TPR) repeat protein